MRPPIVVALTLLLPVAAIAQASPDRQVTDGKLMSRADPAVILEVGKAFRFAGAQTIDIFKVAGAEQYFFVDAAPDSSIRRFYWVQFEHYYPSNDHVYDYSGITQQPVRIGALDFQGDVNVIPGYFTSDTRAGSDSEAGLQLLRAKGYRIAGSFVRLRLFHLPDATRRRELMVIYGEALPSGGSEAAARSAIIQHAQENLKAERPRKAP